jgi:molybdopterin-guanine dinucleotide biosynthesis protein MobB
MKPYVIGFYGKSNTGKTTLITEIIKQLADDGLRIANIKISDKKIDIDKPGKDTYKYAKAGSKLVILSSADETDFMLKQKEETNTIIERIKNFDEYDLIIVEGAKHKSITKIRLGDIEERENTILTYEGDFEELIKIIKEEILRRKNMNKTCLKVNGKKVPLSEFPNDLIKNTICGMLKSLKGVDKIKTVEIYFENE